MSQTIDVNMTPGLFMPTIYYSQGDIGREFKINITTSDGTAIPAGATVKMQATKPSGLGFSVAGTLSGNVATFTTTETMTNEAGRVPAELVLEANGDRIGTANFYWQGEKDPHPQGTVDGDLDDVMPKYMTVTVTSLAPNTAPTYTYDPATNTANFGIPRGADGSLSSGVLAPTYSSSSTYAVGDYVYYNGSLYRCTTAITTAEAWTSGHWAQVALADEVGDLKDNYDALKVNYPQGLSNLGIYTFAVGGFYNGNYTPNIKYRVASRADIVVKDYTILKAKTGYKFNVLTGSAGSYTDITGWVETYNLAPNTSYNICVRRATEDSTEVLTNTVEFTTAVTFVTQQYLDNESNTNNVSKLADGYITPDWGWARGIVTSSVFSVNNTYRVGTPNYITLDKSTKVYIASGFKLGGWYQDGTEWGWQTNEYTILGNKPFRAMIARSSENSSEVITDITEFINAVSVMTKETEANNSIVANNLDVPLLIKQALRPLNITDSQYLTEPKPLVLFHFSDIHGDQTALERLVEFYEEYKTLFDDAICTGDLKAVNTSSNFSFWGNVDGAEDILFSIGNHDATNSDSTLQSESDQYTAMFASYIANWGVTYTSGKTYYYKDYPSSKVRLIVLNNMLSDAENADQLSWFDTVLAGAKTLGYTVLVATHFPNGWGDAPALKCNFTDIDATIYSAQFLRGTYQTKLRDFRVNGGKFACYIGGHVHKDVMKTNEDIPNQVGVMIDACSITQSMAYSDIYRTSGDRTADLANVFVLDASSNTIKVIRVGADRNRYLVSRKTISINYETLEIISQN